jgi:hypothetical protein
MICLDRKRGQGFLGFLFRRQPTSGTEAAGRSSRSGPKVPGHSTVFGRGQIALKRPHVVAAQRMTSQVEVGGSVEVSSGVHGLRHYSE